MAGIWNATEAALRGDLERFAAQAARSTPAIARFAAELLETGLDSDAPLHVVTISFSNVVAHVISAIARRRAVHVGCGEGRPALEGRRLAERLLSAGASVTCYADAALAHALRGSHAVLVGADAVAPEWLVNKSGTFMLAAAAAHQGVAVYALAGREKLLTAEMAARLRLMSGPPEEVWEAGAAGPSVENPYFERVPRGLITAVVTDGGIIANI
jgi:translation initiation factor 2B subunit (eIF-2B alpha/beta/delta family)